MFRVFNTSATASLTKNIPGIVASKGSNRPKLVTYYSKKEQNDTSHKKTLPLRYVQQQNTPHRLAGMPAQTWGPYCREASLFNIEGENLPYDTFPLDAPHTLEGLPLEAFGYTTPQK